MWERELFLDSLLEYAIEAAQVESATGRRYIVLDFWIATGQGN